MLSIILYSGRLEWYVFAFLTPVPICRQTRILFFFFGNTVRACEFANQDFRAFGPMAGVPSRIIGGPN